MVVVFSAIDSRGRKISDNESFHLLDSNLVISTFKVATGKWEQWYHYWIACAGDCKMPSDEETNQGTLLSFLLATRALIGQGSSLHRRQLQNRSRRGRVRGGILGNQRKRLRGKYRWNQRGKYRWNQRGKYRWNQSGNVREKCQDNQNEGVE